MAALTPQHPDKAFIVPMGAFKVEYIYVKTVTNSDTVTSKLANPVFATAQRTDGATGTAMTATVSGKTITISHAAGGTVDCLVIVYGDGVWN